jgi:transcriptional regulator NrdR family protein
MLADGRWVYRRSYECPECGARFTEQQPQQF